MKKVYFVNDIDENNKSDITSNRKAKILLEHLIGYKIKNNKFTTLKQEVYERVHFYDDNKDNVEQANALQFLFEKLLVRTSKELKMEILERIKRNDLFYIVNEITSNKLNPFLKYERKLLPPNNVKLFEEYD